MKVYFPNSYTEAHRDPDRQCDLLKAFDAVGLEYRTDVPFGCDIAFCGSLFVAEHTRRFWPWSLPVVHYNWDLYPWVVQNRKEMGWDAYLEDLKVAAAVLVPGVGTQLRTRQMCGRDAVIVKPPVKVWDVPTKRDVIGNVMYFRDPLPPPGKYALDVMRNYPWDVGWKYPEEACNKLGVQLVRTATETPWDEFRWLVANAGVLISAVDEASTGGLTLLEGYAHGVPVIASDSAWNETARYFGDRAKYFDKTLGATDLAAVIDDVLSTTRPLPSEVAKRRSWVKSTFSDIVFATRVKEEIEKCLNNR